MSQSACSQKTLREAIVHEIAEADKVCNCGSHLIHIGEVITEQLKYILAYLSVVQHVRPKYVCKPCQENVKIVLMLPLFLPKSIATPSRNTWIPFLCTEKKPFVNVWRLIYRTAVYGGTCP
ncbi:IS66 family transposase zinc-finger binding domain-containing protein [Coxiella endosymbiont of Ornithodoros maritimus]|uniref:IS66 family transposase zinc-finger binding domain-containing protein n=1 Tax=Coxiella endosymbiont of Ornithodoros maritimus TaxID=1656172 RepID=UPI002264EAF0|nr:IS66 family transposase zinc-finger binding domain-containing protein [Coxiella endosymbiont of Ornithodoros maritimus]